MVLSSIKIRVQSKHEHGYHSMDTTDFEIWGLKLRLWLLKNARQRPSSTRRNSQRYKSLSLVCMWLPVDGRVWIVDPPAGCNRWRKWLVFRGRSVSSTNPISGGSWIEFSTVHSEFLEPSVPIFHNDTCGKQTATAGRSAQRGSVLDRLLFGVRYILRRA